MCHKYLLPVCRLSSLSLKCLRVAKSFRINVAKLIDLFFLMLNVFCIFINSFLLQAPEDIHFYFLFKFSKFAFDI